MGLPKALIVSSHPSRFVLQDADIVRQAYSVDLLVYRGRRSLPRLVAGALRSSLSIAWFILGYATTLAALHRLTRRPLVLVAGGWDVGKVPEIGYGATTNPRRLRLTRYAIRHADLVLAVSQDIAHATKAIEDREVSVVHLGVDTRRFSPAGERDGSVLTVATAGSIVNSRRKGLPAFVEMARRIPGRTFVVAGEVGAEVRRQLEDSAPANLLVVGHVRDEELLGYYRRASAYYQVSAHEGFGLSVAEAMACGCTPVVSDRGALPEVVGSAGEYAAFDDLTSIEEALHRALEQPKGSEARRRVQERFELSQRRTSLLALLAKLAA